MKDLRRVIFGLLVLWGLGANTACKKNPEKTGAKPNAVAPAAKPKTVEQELAAAEEQLKEISRLLEAHDYLAAGEIHDRVFDRLEKLRHAGNDPVPPRGPKLGDEITRLQNQIADQLTPVLQGEIEALRNGAPDNVNIPRLFKCFRGAKTDKLDQIYAAARPGLDRIRRLHAPQWIRVEGTSEMAEFEKVAIEAIASRIQAPPGCRVVYGSPAGPREEASTYCTFTVHIRSETESYVQIEFARPHEYKALVGLTLTGDLKSRSPDRILARVWAGRDLDREGKLNMAIGASQQGAGRLADKIVVPDGTSAEDFFRAHNRKCSTEFSATIKQRIGALRIFDFHETGGTPRPLTPDQALFDRPAFVAALRAADPGNNAALQAWAMVAELGIEELAPDLAKVLPSFQPDQSNMVIRALAAQPWFGDYEPLLQCIRKGDPRSFSAALKALAGELNEPRVSQEIRDRMARQPEYAQWVGPLAETISPQNLPGLLAGYPHLPPSARAALVTGLMRQHREASGPFLSARLAVADAAELVELCKGMEAAFRGTAYKPPVPLKLTADEKSFLLGTMSRLRGQDRATALSNAARAPEIWIPLFDQPRGDWSPQENLALLRNALTGAKDDTKRSAAALLELCVLVAGDSFPQDPEKTTANLMIGEISDTLRNFSHIPDYKPELMPVLLWLLAQPATSPHARLFAKTTFLLLPNGLSNRLFVDAQCRVLLESGIRHWDEDVRQRTAVIIRAAAERKPSYKELLPK